MFNTLSDFNPQSKRIFVRGDLNVPMVDGVVSDMTRLERLAPTIKALTDKGGRVIVLSHFGRPKGQRNAEMSLKPVAGALAKVLNIDVAFANDCIGTEAKMVIDALQDGQVCVLENVRFHAGEEKNDMDFAKALCENGDAYVNDAFSVSHRAHATTHALATILPAYAGLNMQAELDALTSALAYPIRPVMAIVGGSKVSTKLDVLTNLVDKVDKLIIGGGMANTFLYAKGVNIGASLCEKELADTARAIMDNAEKSGCEIIFPSDVTVASGINDGDNALQKSANTVTDNEMILDIGDVATTQAIAKLKECKTLIWNGPVGAFEFEPFEKGTLSLAHAVAEQVQLGCLVAVGGGGDTVASLDMAGVKEKLTFVSTAGGAFLEWMEGKVLPGVEVLKK